MSAKDAHLYGAPRPKKASTGKEITASSTLAFNSALSSLLANSNGKPGAKSAARSRPAKSKDDIFAVHNRNTKKRAAADMLSYEDDAAKLKGGAAQLDEASWRRTKRKMEEKARLYAAMKRGDVEDEHERHMVDFDRKWAEGEEGGEETSSSSDGSDGEAEETVEYVDEFGRTRKGTKGEAAREERRRRAGERYREEADRFAARPSAPSNIIYGDTVQAAAFNPDEPVAAQMEELVKKRDRELTPPPETHYDADREVRNKGTGFFQFSKDEEERRAQMAELERERLETERAREEKAAQGGRKEERRRAIEEKRRLIRDKRGKAMADKFLEKLGQEWAEKDEPEA